MTATTNGLYIPSVDGKDLYIAANFKNEDRRADGYSLMRADGTHNIAKYINTMDYSLERIKLQEVYERVKRRIDFSFLYNGKRYSNKVINVTFKYSCAEWNMAGRNVFVRFGECERDMRFDDCAAVEGGELIGIVTEREVRRPLPAEVLAPYFSYDKETKTYIKVGTPKKLMSTSDIRSYLYDNGFTCGGTHYIRYKRSSGSSRVGKCLFIADYLYPAMHRWELCGLKVNEGDKIDLAGLESYISLPLSSIVDTIELYPENILVIDDYESEFTDDIVSIEDRDGSVVACEKTQTIRNSIWDGQGLIDKSAMGGYQDKGMILLRNRFFKCCCFNTNLEKWFKDNGITRVDQLCGHTRAMQLSDIKLITTPNSIKYLKFGSLDQWLDNLETTFGVVKYDKKTHYFDGRMVQTHYQLLNTLQMTRDEVRSFLAPTLDYMDMLQRDPAVMRNHIKFSLQEIDPEAPRPAQTKNDIVYTMLGVTDQFIHTQLYADFKKDVLSSYTKHVKLGHVMVDGNYSTLFGNPMEMLNAVIGRFDGRSLLGVGNVHSKRFAYGRRVLGSRSPHISMNSVWTPWNVESNDIDTYFNLTDEIVCINSINENTLWILSGCDYLKGRPARQRAVKTFCEPGHPGCGR